MATAPSSRDATLGRPVGGGRSAEENREHILDAAERCFARIGIDDTTVADIADEAGLSRSLVYRHFQSRDEMVLASVERAGNRLMAAAASAFERSETLAELVTGLLVEVVWRARNDPLLAASFGGTNWNRAASLLTDSERLLGSPGEFETAFRTQRPGFVEELREGLEFADALEFVRTFGMVLVHAPTRIAGSRARIRRYVETFLLPALVADPPAPTL